MGLGVNDLETSHLVIELLLDQENFVIVATFYERFASLYFDLIVATVMHFGFVNVCGLTYLYIYFNCPIS